jgi:hypothetical protein
LGNLYALASRQGECWVETHPDDLTFHFARLEPAIFFHMQCTAKGLKCKYWPTN